MVRLIALLIATITAITLVGRISEPAAEDAEQRLRHLLGTLDSLRAVTFPELNVSLPEFLAGDATSCRDVDGSFVQLDVALAGGYEPGSVLTQSDGTLNVLLIVREVDPEGRAAAIDFASSLRIPALILRAGGEDKVRSFDPPVRNGSNLRGNNDATIDRLSFCYRFDFPEPPQPAQPTGEARATYELEVTPTPSPIEPTSEPTELVLDLSAEQTAVARAQQIEETSTAAAATAAADLEQANAEASQIAATSTAAAAAADTTAAAQQTEVAMAAADLATSEAERLAAEATAASLELTASAPTATPPPTETPTPEPPTATATETPEPPTATPTATPEPPTATATATPEPPTATPTPEPPTDTATPEPPTATATPDPPTATATPEPPTATATLEPPTPTISTVVAFETSGEQPFAGWQSIEGWNLEGQVASASGDGPRAWLVVPVPPGLEQNMAVEVELRVTGGDVCPRNFGVGIRISESGYYAAGVEWACDPEVVFWTGSGYSAKSPLPEGLDLSADFHTLRFSAVGSDVTISIDGTVVISQTAPDEAVGQLVAIWTDGVPLEIRAVRVVESSS